MISKSVLNSTSVRVPLGLSGMLIYVVMIGLDAAGKTTVLYKLKV
jgi:hypothetical protein